MSEIVSRTRQRRTTPRRRVKEEPIKAKCKKYFSEIKLKAWFITVYVNCCFKEGAFAKPRWRFQGGKIRKWSEQWIIVLIPPATVQMSLNCFWLFLFFLNACYQSLQQKKINRSIGLWYLWGIFGWSQGKCAIIKCSSSGKANQATVMMPHMVFSCSTPWWDVHINYELLSSGRRYRVPVKK